MYLWHTLSFCYTLERRVAFLYFQCILKSGNRCTLRRLFTRIFVSVLLFGQFATFEFATFEDTCGTQVFVTHFLSISTTNMCQQSNCALEHKTKVHIWLLGKVCTPKKCSIEKLSGRWNTFIENKVAIIYLAKGSEKKASIHVIRLSSARSLTLFVACYCF